MILFAYLIYIYISSLNCKRVCVILLIQVLCWLGMKASGGRKTSNETNSRADQSASPIMQTSRSTIRPLSLHTSKRILYMFLPQRRPRLRRRQKQRVRRKSVLFIRRLFSSSFFWWTAETDGGFAFADRWGG